MVPPDPRDFGLSEESFRRIEKQNTKDTSLGEILGDAVPFVVCLFLLLHSTEETGWFRLGLGLGTLLFGLLLVSALVSKVARVFRSWVISSEDLAKYAKYRARVSDYSNELAEQQKREEERKQRLYEAKRRKVKWWQSLNGREFEEELAKLLGERGLVARRTGGPGDEGIDLIIERSGKEILLIRPLVGRHCAA